MIFVAALRILKLKKIYGFDKENKMLKNQI